MPQQRIDVDQCPSGRLTGVKRQYNAFWRVYTVRTKMFFCMRQDEITKAIGGKVREARTAAGLSRKRLAEAADVSERYLNDLEKGEANASVGILARLAEALDIQFQALLASPRIGAVTASPQRPLQASLGELLSTLSAAEQRDAVPVLTEWLAERRRALKGPVSYTHLTLPTTWRSS